MNPFPQDWELLALFEAEPRVNESDVPTFYSGLIYETTRGDDFIRCELEPAYYKLKLNWWRGEHEALALELNWVQALRVVTGGGKDYLIASFRDPHLLDLGFHLKPHICLRFGTSSQLTSR